MSKYYKIIIKSLKKRIEINGIFPILAQFVRFSYLYQQIVQYFFSCFYFTSLLPLTDIVMII